jgi:hypothetical protein
MIDSRRSLGLRVTLQMSLVPPVAVMSAAEDVALLSRAFQAFRRGRGAVAAG